jgi:MFS family permease
MNTVNPTRWAVVIAAFGAGVIGAAHIGKVPAALPAMRAEFAMDLVSAGWVVSLFSLTGIVAGMAAGLASDRLGHRALAIGGLVLLAVGSAAGAAAGSGPAILVTRFMEGLGYIIAIVSAPSIIAQAAAPTAGLPSACGGPSCRPVWARCWSARLFCRNGLAGGAPGWPWRR